jgi:uncharacterized protein YbgA (DUF1722 family)
MKVEIVFEKPDNFAASAIRGLAAQIEGYQKVKGQSNMLMAVLGSLDFDFSSEEQAQRFEYVVRKYIASEILNDIKIKIISN